jgi:hypothetical protein
MSHVLVRLELICPRSYFFHKRIQNYFDETILFQYLKKLKIQKKIKSEFGINFGDGTHNNAIRSERVKIQIFWTVKVQLVIIKLLQIKTCNFNTRFLYRKLSATIIRLLNIKK